MELMMYIGNDFIESIPLDPDSLRKPGYVGSFKRFLKTKYHEMINQSGTRAEFLVIHSVQQQGGSGLGAARFN